MGLNNDGDGHCSLVVERGEQKPLLISGEELSGLRGIWTLNASFWERPQRGGKKKRREKNRIEEKRKQRTHKREGIERRENERKAEEGAIS